MTPWVRRIHQWIGVAIGLQLLVWMCSGLAMSWLDAQRVAGREFRAPAPVRQAWPLNTVALQPLIGHRDDATRSVSTGWLLERPVYRLTGEQSTQLFDAMTGQRIELDAALARRLAQASYRGPGRAGPAQWVEPSLETRSHQGKVWRVAFSDAEDTTVYLSRQGDVLEHRNKTWRLFDLFWMLHIMDYTGRQDFNHPLIVTTAVGGLWLALSGVWLLFTSFSVADFIPRRWRGVRALKLHAPAGDQLHSLPARAGDTVFGALLRHGLPLPSHCGGGQTCGLCEVRVQGAAPQPTSADRTLIPPSRIAAGCRLACNLRLDHDLDIEVGNAAALGAVRQAEVVRVRALSPFMRELVLRPSDEPDAAYRPGAYIQLHVPAYRMDRAQIDLPPEHQAAWSVLPLPAQWASGTALRRAYSLSSPVESSGGCLTLLVRFCHGAQGGRTLPPGKGSAFAFGLKAGDRLQYSGPFGDFALRQGERERIFIGGGAGMAPLRAMVLDLLARGATEPIHFWFGARSAAEAPYLDEMQSLAQRHQHFNWHLVPSEEALAGHPCGLVHQVARDALLRMQTELHACGFYLCGPPLMLAATRAMLKALGVADERVAFDDFKI